MNKNLRTAMIVALVVIGLLVGATFALAQSDDDPAPASDSPATSLEQIAEEFEADVAPLLDDIRDGAFEAIDDALAAGVLTEEQADIARDRVDGFGLPEGFPFHPGHRVPWFEFDGADPECFGFGSDAVDKPEDCPELPEGFPFDGHGFPFGRMPGEFDTEKLERLGDEIEKFVDDLDFDFEQLEELLESGMTPDEALEEMGFDLQALFSEIQAAALERIEELAADGTISEEKAELLRDTLEGIDLSAGLPFGLHHFDFDLDDFGRWGPHGHHHLGEDPEDG